MVRMPAPGIRERLREMDILAPIDEEALHRWRPANRLTGLQGKVGGFLGNRKGNADALLMSVRELLDKQFELSDTVVVDKFIYSRPAADSVIDTLAARCDFVVTAIAD
jgi:hypothetical protein